jgi:uncharacterized repeat protein (TIGR01451 family)
MPSNFRPFGHIAIALAVMLGSAANAQNFATDPNGDGARVAITAPEGVCGATIITQSATQNIVSLNSVACPSDNDSYFRAFNMGTFPDGFNACSVQFGVETATGPGGVQPIVVNVYASTGAAFPGGTLALVGTANVSLPDQVATVVNTPLTAAIPPGAEMVVEVFAADTANSSTFFIGSNPDGQTGASYLQSAGCGAPTPVDTGALGFPNMHVVMNVIGDPVASEADLAITMVAGSTAPVVLGSTVNFTLEVSNAGPADATGVVVTDTLPSGLSFVSSTCAATAAGQVVTWNVGALANGASTSCSLSARVLTVGALTNTATVTATNADSVTANNSASAAVTGVAPIAADSLSIWSWLALLLGTLLIAGIAIRRS